MAVSWEPGFTRFDRWGEPLGRLHVSAASHTEALDGTDEISVTCEEDVSKGDRIVWSDRRGVAREHIVDTQERTHDATGAPMTTATCVNSATELWDDYIEDKRPSGSASAALASVLSGTRWQVGACDLAADASHTFYHLSAREALTEAASTWGGEIETSITADASGVTSRAIGLRAARGDQHSAKRFAWTKDLISISRSIGCDDPKTRVYGYGRGVETDTGGYGRRLTFGSINGGRDYVEDAEATAIWGHPDGHGGVAPAVGVYIDEDCEDAEKLLTETKAYLASAREPKVSYRAEVADLAAFGLDWEDVGLGDRVAIIDRGFGPAGMRLRGRVSQIERDLLAGDVTVTFGNLIDAMSDMWAATSEAQRDAQRRGAQSDAVADAAPGWLERLQDGMNEQFDRAGSHRVETFELGTIWSSVPLDGKTGLPVKRSASMWAININGAGFRIASALTASGSWDWRTFGTGEGFTADLINAGAISADRVSGGTLDGDTVDIRNVSRIGRDGSWALTMKPDSIVMADRAGTEALDIAGSASSTYGWQMPSFPLGEAVQVPSCPMPDATGNRVVDLAVNFGMQPPFRHLHISCPAGQNHVEAQTGGYPSGQFHDWFVLDFDPAHNAMAVKAIILDGSGTDVSPTMSRIPFLSLRFQVSTPTVDISVAGGRGKVLTTDNFAGEMGSDTIAAYTGTFMCSYIYNNIWRNYELTFSKGVLTTIVLV